MQIIYGIDVSKNHLDIYSELSEQKIFKQRIKNSLAAIESFLLSIEKQSIICAEHTGGSTVTYSPFAVLIMKLQSPWLMATPYLIAWVMKKENLIKPMLEEFGNMQTGLPINFHSLSQKMG